MPLPVSVSDSPLSTHVPLSPAFQASLVPQPILEEKEPEDLAFDAPNHGDFSNLDLDFLDNYDVSPKKDFLDPMGDSVGSSRLFEYDGGDGFSFEDSIFNFDGNLSSLDLDDFFIGNNTGNDISKVIEDFAKEFSQGERVSHVTFYLLSILYGIVIFIGVVGNFVILYAILSKSVMRTARNYFIVILALSDLMLCIMTMPLTLWIVLSRPWPFGKDLEWLCQLAHSCQGVPVFMSSMGIVAIACDRYRCIMQPERQQFTANVALFLSLCMIMLAIALSVPMFVFTRLRKLVEFQDGIVPDIFVCEDTWEGHSKVLYTIVSSSAQFLLPFLVVNCIYFQIYLRLRKRPQSQRADNNNRRKRAHLMIVSITLIFFVSWLPLNLFSLIMEVCPHFLRPYIEGHETVAYSLLHLCGLCNACINPVLYGYLNENFRKEYKNIYRQMPWYSTSNYQPPAIHLHIMTNPDPEKDGLEDGSVLSLGAAAAPIPNGVSPAKEEQQHQQNCQSPPPVADDADNPNSHNHNSSNNNNNNNEAESDNSHIVDEVFQESASNPLLATSSVPSLPNGSSAKHCLVITTSNPSCLENLEPQLACESILKAAKKRSFSLATSSQQKVRFSGRRFSRKKRNLRDEEHPDSFSSSFKRRMTLPGLGEVQVETAILSQQNNETKLYKIDEKRMGGFGEDIEARGGETKANEGQGSSEHGAEPKDKDKKKKQMPQEDLYVIVLAGRATTATSTSENGTGNFSSRRGASINEKKVHGTDSGWIGRRVRPRSNSFSQARSSEAAQLLSVKAFRPDIEKGVGKNSREAGGDSSRKKKPLSRRRTTLLNYVNWGSNPDNGKYPVHPVDLEGLQETAV